MGSRRLPGQSIGLREQSHGHVVGPVRRFLDVDARDVGCDGAMRVVDTYVDLLGLGVDAPTRYLGAAEHYVACGCCARALQGIVAVVRDQAISTRDP